MPSDLDLLGGLLAVLMTVGGLVAFVEVVLWVTTATKKEPK